MRKTRSVGIDVGTASVKVVVLHRRAGKLEMAGAAVVDVPAGAEPAGAPAPEALAGAVREAIAVAGARGLEAAVAIPQHQALLRLVRLPGAPSEQLARAATLEGTRDLPFAAGAVTAGVLQEPGESAGETLALVASAQTSMVDGYRKAAAAAGAAVGSLGVSTLAMAAAAEAGEAPWILMDVGGNATTLCLCSGGLPRVSRSVMVGGAHLTRAIARDLNCDEAAAEELKRSRGLDALRRLGPAGSGEMPPATGEWLSQIASEVKLLLSAAAAQGQSAPGAIRLAGGGGQLAGLGPALERAVGVPVEMLVVPALAASRPGDAGRLAAACGMALAAMGEARTPDLLAVETERTRRLARRRHQQWGGAALALLLLAAGGIGAHRGWRDHQKAAKERSAAAHEAAVQRGALKALEQKRATLAAQAAMLRSSLRPSPAWIEVVDALAVSAPSGVWVTGIELDRGKPLTVRGTALDASGAARFVTALMGSPLFERVQLSFANGAVLGGRRVTHFGISAVVKGNLPEKRAPAGASRRPTASAAKGSEE